MVQIGLQPITRQQHLFGNRRIKDFILIKQGHGTQNRNKQQSTDDDQKDIGGKVEDFFYNQNSSRFDKFKEFIEMRIVG